MKGKFDNNMYSLKVHYTITLSKPNLHLISFDKSTFYERERERGEIEKGKERERKGERVFLRY